MRAAIAMETRKLASTRLWWVLLLVMAGYMVFLAVLMAFTSVQGAQAPASDPESTALGVYTLATALGYVFPAIVGTLSVTSEVRHRTLAQTLLADPSRGRLVAAKMIGAVPVGLAIGVVGSLACLGAGAATFTLLDVDPLLGSPAVWRAVGLSVVALTLWTMVGVGLGTVLTNQVAALVVILAFTQFVEPILRGALSLALDGRLAGVASYLPGAAGEAMTGASVYATFGMAELLTWWQGALVLAGYALTLALVGRLTTLRRDLT
jgi:ABC-2 type transport system permease protein